MFSLDCWAAIRKPKVPALFFQLYSIDTCGSFFSTRSLRNRLTWPEIVFASRSSGLRVCTITVPPIEPSSRRASVDLNTSTLPTSCGASRE